MTDSSKVADAALAHARREALQAATAEARRLAQMWRDEAEGNHSSQHSNLRRTWSDAAEKVAEAIEALIQQGEADKPDSPAVPQHKRPHHL
jgi:hypothetical protein